MPAKNSVKTYQQDNFYHIYNRGANKNPIFVDNDDKNKFLSIVARYLDPANQEVKIDWRRYDKFDEYRHDRHISRYIHKNHPNYKNYSYSSYKYYAGEEPPAWLKPRGVLSKFKDVGAYLRFINEDIDINEAEFIDHIRADLA
jgi:hypothetical protein